MLENRIRKIVRECLQTVLNEKIDIPPIPIYNSNRYVNLSPISSDSLKAGQTFIQNDKGYIMYLSYTNGDKITCIFFDSDGNYINTSNASFDAVATFINNNQWDLTKDEITVINPYNTDKTITFNKQKQIKEGNHKMNNLKKIIKESVISALMEQSFNEQWEKEIKIFFDGLENGEAIVDNGYVAVEWGNDETDPRYIYYKEGENCLTDDHFSMQHSRKLYWNEISKIRDCARQIYGVNIEIPEEEYWDELEDWEK